MSVKYFCDGCGIEVEDYSHLYHRSIDGYEKKGSPSIGNAWEGDLCLNCLSSVDYEADAAALREIKRIQSENSHD